MFKYEEKLLRWIDTHLFSIVLLGLTLLSLLIRYSLKDFVSGDAYYFLLRWYDAIRQEGGLAGLGTPVGNYNMLYQFCIAVMTHLPIDALIAYKLLSIIFDYLLAGAVGLLVYELAEKNRKQNAAFAYMAVILSPIVFLNSAAWAQCDAIYTFFAVLALLYMVKEQYIRAFVFYGLSFAFKLQAVFLLPFFLFIYYTKKKFSILHFFAIPLSMIVTSLPCLVQGRKVFEVFGIYMGQTNEWPAMQNNYPTIWLILDEGSDRGYLYLKSAAIMMTVAVLALLMVIFIIKKIQLNKQNMICMAFLLAYTCILFLPSMHERYGYLVEILAIAVVLLHRRTLPLMLLLYGITLQTYGNYLFGKSVDLPMLCIVNTAVYAAYIIMLMKRMTADRKQRCC